MSEKIKPEVSGPVPASFYNTLIPSLDDNANIQQALRMYHYGTEDGAVPDDSGNPVGSESIASYLGQLQAQITAFDIGSEYSDTAPADPENGFVWVDSESSASILAGTVVSYQDAEPTTGLVDGLLWVDKDSSPLKMYVYDAGMSEFREIGA